jgi:hypothetical protein
MKHKALAILLISLLGGMAIYYYQSVSAQTSSDPTLKVEKSK